MAGALLRDSTLDSPNVCCLLVSPRGRPRVLPLGTRYDHPLSALHNIHDQKTGLDVHDSCLTHRSEAATTTMKWKPVQLTCALLSQTT